MIWYRQGQAGGMHVLHSTGFSKSIDRFWRLFDFSDWMIYGAGNHQVKVFDVRDVENKRTWDVLTWMKSRSYSFRVGEDGLYRVTINTTPRKMLCSSLWSIYLKLNVIVPINQILWLAVSSKSEWLWNIAVNHKKFEFNRRITWIKLDRYMNQSVL